MVWGANSRKGRLPLVFIDREVTVNAEYYKKEVLQRILLPEAQKFYEDECYCFQQDGAPSHTANIVQRWCEDNLTDFITKDEWPPSSPDLNPLDFSIWGYILRQLKNKRLCLVIKVKGKSIE
jgi:hypothetical protein